MFLSRPAQPSGEAAWQRSFSYESLAVRNGPLVRPQFPKDISFAIHCALCTMHFALCITDCTCIENFQALSCSTIYLTIQCVGIRSLRPLLWNALRTHRIQEICKVPLATVCTLVFYCIGNSPTNTFSIWRMIKTLPTSDTLCAVIQLCRELNIEDNLKLRWASWENPTWQRILWWLIACIDAIYRNNLLHPGLLHKQMRI